jgi:hypothetical protein
MTRTWKAQQDCRSYKNTGIFDGENPDLQGNQNAWGIYAENGRIAVMEEATPWNPQDQVNTNARLIAAAPELLEACQYVVKWHREHDSGEGELFGLDFVTTCIAAIRKAKGPQ